MDPIERIIFVLLVYVGFFCICGGIVGVALSYKNQKNLIKYAIIGSVIGIANSLLTFPLLFPYLSLFKNMTIF